MTTKGAVSAHNLVVRLTAGEWVSQARCTPQVAELFWPLPGRSSSPAIEAALKLCSRCPVIRDCGQWALDNNVTEGIWGGMRPGALQRLVAKQRAGEKVEPTPQAQPKRRPLATHCGRGHQLKTGDQRWPCNQCNNEAKRRHRQRKREERLAEVTV